jgi:hypothetical protein
MRSGPECQNATEDRKEVRPKATPAFPTEITARQIASSVARLRAPQLVLVKCFSIKGIASTGWLATGSTWLETVSAFDIKVMTWMHARIESYTRETAALEAAESAEDRTAVGIAL